MKQLVAFCALCALLGCHQVAEPSGEVIALYCSTSEQSKTDILTSGDQIGVFASIEGTENCFLDNAKYVVGSDGRSLDCGSTVYYPDPKQAVRFFACFPYHTGTFSVPTDQSTALALKQADLCWAAASSIPVKTAVPLEFAHQLARLLITTNQASAKIVAPNLFSGGTLDIRTGVFTNTLKADISTPGNELIIPVQPLARLVLTVSNVEYVFDTAPIALQAGQTTTLNLTLHPATKTATLSGSSTTNWISSASEGNPTQAVSNILTLHWPSYLPQGAVPDRVIFTIGGTDYTVASGVTYANKTFTVPFASAALRYPYTITKIAFNNIPLACTQLLGATIYKSGASTIGIKDVPNAILINGLWWATGNLVASSSTAGAQGVGGCKIGAPGDYGLYFQFGSLVGWSGGSSGSGVGQGSPALDKAVWPSAMGASKPSFAWPSNNGSSAGDRTTVVDQYFFNYNVAPYSTGSQDIRGFSGSFTGDAGSGNLGTGRYAKWGIGDPCTYYLGGTWRLPLTTDYVLLCNDKGGSSWLAWTAVGGSWATSPTNGGNFSSNQLFFPASGLRDYLYGSFYYVTTRGDGWSSAVYTAANGCNLAFDQANGVIPQHDYGRSGGFLVRCVRPAL